jgi:Ca2+-transporting ATPase
MIEGRQEPDGAPSERPVTLSAIIPASVAGMVPPEPGNPQRRAFYAVAPAAAAAYWGSSLADGLSRDEAEKRLSRLGPNKLAEEPPPSLLRRLLSQISDFTVLALIAAAAIAAALSIFVPEPGRTTFFARFGDSSAILLIVILNAILGLVQERRAQRALSSLRDLTSPVARVVRGGDMLEIAAQALAPGDVVLIEEGDKIPADIRLASTADLEIEEATLTGESVPVSKDAVAEIEPAAGLADRVTMAFMGTRVTRGRARGLVVNTGMHTELGSIAGMLAKVTEEPTPLQRQLEHFGKEIVIGCVAISAVVFLAGWLAAGQRPREMFLVAVSLAVAAIPEGLPAITTIVLALGTQRMARRKALVRNLPAVETLGCVQVVCADKTGTLTQNAMTVRRLWAGGATYEVGGESRDVAGAIIPTAAAGDRADLALVVHAASHASGARVALRPDEPGKLEASGDPTDAALLVLGWKGKGLGYQPTVTGEIAFSSTRRLATVIATEGGRSVAYVRGAPEVVLGRATHVEERGVSRPLTEEDRRRITASAGAWGEAAMRVLALAIRRTPPGDGDLAGWERELSFVGLVGIVDPPRPEIKAAVAEAARAGIRTVMITGDHPATARAVAREVGLWTEGDLAITGAELDGLDQQRLEGIIQRVRVVARATAAHKLRIVDAFKARGFICAMTGDGVNDAPAVKAAHIGIAMGHTGTEVTKEAADLILADDNYATIIAAVEEGRAIYANIRKFIYFLLSSNAGIVLMVLAASLLAWNAPLTPIQILWINLITNGLPALALGVDPRDPEQMAAPPRVPAARLMPTGSWVSLTIVGAIMAVAALGAFAWAGGAKASDPQALAHARTLAFAVLAVAPMFHAFNCRSSTASIFKLGLFTNQSLWGAILVGVGLQSLAIFVPALHPVFKTTALSGLDVGVVFALSAAHLLLGEIVKVFRRARSRL